MTATTEQQVYADQNVLISTTRLIINGVTYPLSNVSSVHLTTKAPNYGFAVFLFVAGALTCFANLIAGLVCAGIGVVLCFTLKSEYIMLIGSAGGEKAALTSPNHSYMAHVVEQINNAIIARG